MLSAETLSRLQIERHETNYALAKAIGVHQTTVKNWKVGKSTPCMAHISRLADHFGVSMGELFTKEDAQ